MISFGKRLMGAALPSGTMPRLQFVAFTYPRASHAKHSRVALLHDCDAHHRLHGT